MRVEQFDVASDVGSVPEARRAASRALRGTVPDEVLDAVELVVSELVGNAVRHGRPMPGDSVRVSWWVAGGAVHLEVCDAGPGLGPAGERTGALAREGDGGGPAPVPTGAEGGRGLTIVDLLSARWGTTAPSPGRAVGVWAEIPVPGAEPARLSRGGRSRPALRQPEDLRRTADA